MNSAKRLDALITLLDNWKNGSDARVSDDITLGSSSVTLFDESLETFLNQPPESTVTETEIPTQFSKKLQKTVPSQKSNGSVARINVANTKRVNEDQYLEKHGGCLESNEELEINEDQSESDRGTVRSTESSLESEEEFLRMLNDEQKLPTKIKIPTNNFGKGRRKGSKKKNIIGTLKKHITVLTPFAQLPTIEQVKKMLTLLVPAHLVRPYLQKQGKIKQSVLTVNEQTISDAFKDDDVVDIDLLKEYFDDTAFAYLQKLVAQKVKSTVFTCGTCQKPAKNSDSVMCECCLLWNHLACQSLKKASSVKFWFCSLCTSKL